MFSILTPTYNRSNELPRVYDSLVKQTFRDFEWIIVDDGSTDDTAEVVRRWQSKKLDFKITYHLLPKNKGKSYAVNEGLELCKRPYTIIADSDDTFSEKTLEDLKLIWEGVEKTDNSDKIGAIWTLVEDESSKLVGEPWPKNFWQVSFEERVLNRKKPIQGEKWHCWRTEVLQNYKIYTNKNSHIGPGVTWNRINRDYDFLCVNVIHRTYWYTPNSIINQKKSKLKIEKRNYYGATLELKNQNIGNILSKRYYRNLAFKYIKSLFYYKDENLKLSNLKLVVSTLVFIYVLPSRIFDKIIKK